MKSDKQITALQLVVLSKQQIGEEAFEIDKRWMNALGDVGIVCPYKCVSKILGVV